MPLRYFLPLLVLLLSALPGRAQFIFQKSLGQPGIGGIESAAQMIALRAGGYVLAGTTAFVPYLLRVDEQGDTVWTRSYPTAYAAADFNGALYGGGIAENRSGQLLFTLNGYRRVNGRSDFGGLLLLVDSHTGQLLWSETYQSPFGDGYGPVRLGNDGNFVLVGGRLGQSMALKLDSTGADVWANFQPGIDSLATGPSLIVPISGGYVVANHVSPTVNRLYFLNEQGQTVDSTTGFRGSHPYRCVRDWHGNFLFCNGSFSKVDPQGNLLWRRDYQISGAAVGTLAVACTPDSNYIVLGRRSYQLQTDWILLKIAPNGQLIRSEIFYRPQGDEYPVDVLVDAQGNYVLYGWTTSGTVPPGGTWDLILAKYTAWPQTLSAPEEAAARSAIALFPNPTTDRVTLRGATPLAGHLLVRDVLGRELARQPLAPTATATCSLAAYPPGLYLLTYEPQTGAAPRTWRVVRQ